MSSMLGAIVGDVVGSVYEWNNIRTKEFELFDEKCDFTDDTVMTLAVAQALMQGGASGDYASCMQRLGREWPGRGYGLRFLTWLHEEEPEPYNSFGNGSAMRVAPVAWCFNTLQEVEQAAAASAAVTHNHPEGIRGAQATAAAIFLAREGKGKQETRRYIENTYGYNLSRTLDEIRPNHTFNETCMYTVPEALTAFLESTDFEDALRNAISLGGDSDTLAAITCAVAEAAYGIPEDIRRMTCAFLPPELKKILTDFEAWAKERRGDAV